MEKVLKVIWAARTIVNAGYVHGVTLSASSCKLVVNALEYVYKELLGMTANGNDQLSTNGEAEDIPCEQGK